MRGVLINKIKHSIPYKICYHDISSFKIIYSLHQNERGFGLLNFKNHECLWKHENILHFFSFQLLIVFPQVIVSKNHACYRVAIKRLKALRRGLYQQNVDFSCLLKYDYVTKYMTSKIHSINREIPTQIN